MSNTLQYRAILEDGDSTRERPLQIFGTDIKTIRDWANGVLDKALDGAVVNIYQTIEQHVQMIPKPKPEAPAK